MRSIMPVVLLLGVACLNTARSNDALVEFKACADKYKAVISLPEFETSPQAIADGADKAIAAGGLTLDRIGKVDAKGATFQNTIVALDDLRFEFNLELYRLALIEQTATNAAMRGAATEAIKKLSEWLVGMEYREDVYRAVKAFAGKKPRLKGEDKRLFDETLRDYRRAGMDLPRAERDEVERLRKELTLLETDYQNNITKAEKSVTFSRADLEGLPEDFLSEVKTGPDQYTVKANITWHYITVLDTARREETRKRLAYEECNLAREVNIPLLKKVLSLRDSIAKKLGYEHYADYAIEPKMAKDARTARKFLEDLQDGLQPKFEEELETLRQMKAADTGNTAAIINVWDWRYYANELKKQKYKVDKEQLRVYFPYQQVLNGMFAVYQRIFGLKFQRMPPPYKWVADLELYAVSDARTGEPLGLFYLDMFPRDGKYNHFAVFPLIEGKRLQNGTYQRPVCALVCNFPAPSADRPPLMSHDDVETLFHEFGHAMHDIVTRAKYSRFSGANVPGDFVEAPSQMLENWTWNKQVLDTFAADYRDPSKKIPEEILAQLQASRLSTEAMRYRRQLSFGLMDLALHSQINATNLNDVLPLSNQVLGDVFLPPVPDTAFIGYFGHIIGYGAGYYGYAWADAISADMATVFEKSRDCYFDEAAGLKLRREIYEVGNSRDVNTSIDRFLGRKRSLDPFLKRIGAKN